VCDRSLVEKTVEDSLLLLVANVNIDYVTIEFPFLCGCVTGRRP
jgi:hypothetical protein